MTTPVLIETAELAERLATGAPLVLADVRWTLNGPPGRPEFEAGHLPGADWVDLEHALSGPPGEGGRHPLPDPATFVAAVQALGVDPDTEVVVYDAGSALAASRLWWLLGHYGHTRVRVLNGGYAAWMAEGRPSETGPAAPRTAGTFTGTPGHRSTRAADDLTGGRAVAVDVRAPERYTGETEPIDPVAGHIPGARNRPSMDNLGPDGRLRAPADILARYVDLERPVFYCGSGITAAHTLLALESAGRHDGAIYPGSWSEWIRDPTRPVATGEQP
ncbi:MAG: sseA [Friedmanniella sp.]|nr:sseA [Friedmanniella sp.]